MSAVIDHTVRCKLLFEQLNFRDTIKAEGQELNFPFVYWHKIKLFYEGAKAGLELAEKWSSIESESLDLESHL